jgi:hypothetical protein
VQGGKILPLRMSFLSFQEVHLMYFSLNSARHNFDTPRVGHKNYYPSALDNVLHVTTKDNNHPLRTGGIGISSIAN